jgi:hypothetical protein
MHSRIFATAVARRDERTAAGATQELIEISRRSRLDTVEDLRLPDLALLAHLQHHGAATPLLDVTVDPLVAMWMVGHASGPDFTRHDDKDGLLFAIRRPSEDHWLEPLDARLYSDFERHTGDVASHIQSVVHWYRPPAISERLRIQRGSFLIGPFTGDRPCTLPLKFSPDRHWIHNRISQLGERGRPIRAETDVVAFRIRAGIKEELRIWLDERAGLTQESIYPTPWHRPFLQDFCRSYGRHRPLDY